MFWTMTPAELGAVLYGDAAADRPPRWDDFAELDARYGAPSGSIVATEE